jgi:hypothetical protein
VSDQAKQFLCVPLELLQAKLSPGAMKALLGLLSFRNRRTGRCNPSIETVRQRLDVPLGTLRHWMRELRHAGIVISSTARGTNSYEFAPGYIGVSKSGQGGCPNLDGGVSKFDHLEPPHPLYEQKKRTEAAPRAAASSKKNSFNAPPPRKSAQSETLEAYYREQRRKAAT